MAFAKFQENRFKIDGEIAENLAILVNLTASIMMKTSKSKSKSPRGGHERRKIMMDHHPFSHETSIFTLGAP